MVKNLPAMQETKETRVQSLGQEDPLEKGTTPQPSVLARKVLWTRVRPHVTQRHDCGLATALSTEGKR